MILMSVVVFLVLVSVVKSFPMPDSRYDDFQDEAPILLLLDHRIPELQNEMFDSGNDPKSTVIRTKRTRTLSIVNSLDVLRQRVLLELARRKAEQDRRQIDANRRIMETVGKRSLPLFNADISKTLDSKTRRMLERVLANDLRLL